MSTYIRNLAELRREDAGLAGGKGANLGDMIGAGIPVPPGFVVLAPAYDEFALHGGLNAETGAEILRAFDALGAKEVAVRSSATAEDGNDAAWAGQLESYLYVTRDNLLDTIQKSWASIASPRVAAYRQEKWLDKIRVSVAVVVQRMIVAEVSGVAFTTNPVTGSNSELMIEAVLGDNDQLVGGEITPDNYLINKHSSLPLWVAVSPQTTMRRRGQQLPVPAALHSVQKLAGSNLAELVTLCRKIETHFGKPMDIEWVHDAAQFYIVQARPITTLG